MNPAKLWPAAVVGVLAVTVIANVFLLYEVRDPDAAAVEPDYYRRAVAYDSTMSEQAHSDSLGWRTAVELGVPGPAGATLLRVTLTDRVGTALDGARVRVRALNNRIAAHAVEGTLVATGGGSYAATLPLRRTGLWQLDITVDRGVERFATSVRCDTGTRTAP